MSLGAIRALQVVEIPYSVAFTTHNPKFRNEVPNDLF